jgi:hypothetical protein
MNIGRFTYYKITMYGCIATRKKDGETEEENWRGKRVLL